MSDSDDNSQEMEIQIKEKKNSFAPIIMNIYDTNYQVIRQVAQDLMKWKLIYDPENMDWDVYWTDCGVAPEALSRMKCIKHLIVEHQKINHFPGMYIIARKNNLAKQLGKMRKRFPQDYNFFPQTWLLPTELNEFREYCKNKKDKHFIVKPEAGCQGRGIFLTRNSDFSNNLDRCVVQKYLTNPFLIDDLKFDFRIYVLVAGCDPLRLFIYTEGLARFSTEPYEAPNQQNYSNLCMHLTNYAINKNNENFVFNDDVNKMDVGHKRTMSSVFENLREMGHDIDLLWMEIKQIIIKTLCSAQPFLKHQYATSQPNNLMNNMCFEILGFDVMLDHNFKPYILEVNHSPSFTTDSPLDAYIKSNLIQDSLILMNITPEEKQRMIQEKSNEMKKRIYTGRNIRLTSEDRKQLIQQCQLIRDAYEDDHLGGFEKIYPCDEDYETEHYTKFINYASDLFEESTGTKKPIFVKKSVIQTTPQKIQNKRDEITQIYSKASVFYQKQFLKSQQGARKSNQIQQQQLQNNKLVNEDYQFRDIAYRQMIKQQILSEQKKIQELIKQRKKQDESRLSQSYQRTQYGRMKK